MERKARVLQMKGHIYLLLCISDATDGNIFFCVTTLDEMPLGAKQTEVD